MNHPDRPFRPASMEEDALRRAIHELRHDGPRRYSAPLAGSEE